MAIGACPSHSCTHDRRSASVQHVRSHSLLHTQALGFSLGRPTATLPHSPTGRSARGARAPGTRANGSGAAGRLHFVEQIGQHELQALLSGARVEEPRGGRHAAQQGIAILRRKAVYLRPADKYHRRTRWPLQGQKGLDEQTLRASQWSSEPW